jgi:hypothetical protein
MSNMLCLDQPCSGKDCSLRFTKTSLQDLVLRLAKNVGVTMTPILLFDQYNHWMVFDVYLVLEIQLHSVETHVIRL